MNDPYFTIVDSPIGELLLTGDDKRLTGLLMTESGDHRAVSAARTRRDDVFAGAATQLDEYFAGERENFDLRLDPSGTPFQLKVWSALREIPFGETRSYGQIAATIGQPKAARAVGTANNRNPIAVIVPCHRVIGTNGALVGYAGGLDRKRLLLSLERGDD
jgi:methylated-DNA-[protein]-cysteine S-methyltransferase